jgi:hypothetical protein
MQTVNWQQMDAQEQTAEAQVRLARLSMQLAAFSMVEAEMLPYSDIGRDEFLKYRSPADTPLLAPWTIVSHYMTTSAVTDGVQAAREFIESQLPPDILQQLRQQLKRPEVLRDPSFVALDQAIQQEAVLFDWVQRTSQAVSAEETAISKGEVNCAIPEIVLNNLITDGKEILGSLRTTLYAMGPNVPGYDNLSHLINETDETLTTLETL